jgi:hypothetical protein
LCFTKLDELEVRWVEVGVGGGCDAGQAFEKSWGGSVEVLIGDAEDASLTDGLEMVPISLSYDAVEGDAISCTAPGEEENVGIGGGNFFWRGVGAGDAEVTATGDFDQLGDPVLGVDERLAPLFAVDSWSVSAVAAPAGGCHGGLHLRDESFGCGLGVDDGGDEADVLVNVGQIVRGEGEDGEARFEDRGKGLHTVRDAGEDEIGLRGEDLFGVGCPAVVEDVWALFRQLGESFQAVFGAGAEVVEAVEGREGDGDRGLEGGYAHVLFECMAREEGIPLVFVEG